jgi:hypothetical protein
VREVIASARSTGVSKDSPMTSGGIVAPRRELSTRTVTSLLAGRALTAAAGIACDAAAPQSSATARRRAGERGLSLGGQG